MSVDPIVADVILTQEKCILPEPVKNGGPCSHTARNKSIATKFEQLDFWLILINTSIIY